VKRYSFICSLAALTLLPMIAGAQSSKKGTGSETPEVPKVEIPMGYSYLSVHPTKSQVTSFNMNGGGAGFVYNVSSLIGVKADFMGYTGSVTATGTSNAIKVTPTLFTYLFGPQFTVRKHKVNYFAEALFGAGHTSAAWAQAVHPTGTTGTVYNSNNSFMMEYGGGVDFKVNPHVAIRPVEVDYLFGRYSANGVSAQQNSFKYVAGINLMLGSK
jgi:hypothetical protein